MHKCHIRGDQGAVGARVEETQLRRMVRLQRHSPGAETVKSGVCGGSKTRAELMAPLRKCVWPGLAWPGRGCGGKR